MKNILALPLALLCSAVSVFGMEKLEKQLAFLVALSSGQLKVDQINKECEFAGYKKCWPKNEKIKYVVKFSEAKEMYTGGVVKVSNHNETFEEESTNKDFKLFDKDYSEMSEEEKKCISKIEMEHMQYSMKFFADFVEDFDLELVSTFPDEFEKNLSAGSLNELKNAVRDTEKIKLTKEIADNRQTVCVSLRDSQIHNLKAAVNKVLYLTTTPMRNELYKNKNGIDFIAFLDN